VLHPTVNILFLGINYWPEETGIAAFTTGRCEYLAAHGHDVTICTAFPYYPDWRTQEGYRGRILARQGRNGVDIRRTWIYVPKKVTPLRRVVHEASFLATSFLRALPRSRPDLVVAVSPPLGLALSAVVLSRHWRVPYIFHVADLQPDAAVDLGMLPRGRMVKTLYGIERMAYRDAALVTTLTPAMRRKIVLKGIPENRVGLCPDWAESALFDLPLTGGGSLFRKAYGFEDRFLVVHAGNMGVKQGLEVALGAANLARHAHPHILFLLVGDGATRAKLDQAARGMQLDNLRFLPILGVDLFRDMLAASDVCLITQQKSVADIVFPSKVLTLLAAGRPVVASLSSGSEVARVLREADAGLVVEPENSQALLDTVVELYSNPHRRAAMGANGRAYAREHWDRGRILSEFEERLLETGSRGSSSGTFHTGAGMTP
jgi:colanic acid biosynthesis glycosyl transferase WcaI